MTRPRGRPQRYPWETWLDGRPHDIPLAEHDVSALSLQKQIRRRAAGEGLDNLRTKVVDDVLQIRYRARRHADYRWSAWLDGEVHILRRGVDFDCSPASFQRQARRAARARELDLRSKSRRSPEGYREVALRAYPKGTAP